MADRSRTNLSGMSELEAREAEAEEARARLSRTLETLTGPDTREAVKAEVLGHVQSNKDELLKQADRYKDELLRRADEYKGELLARAETYKGEIMDRAEQYKGEFLHRADGYKNEALQRARRNTRTRSWSAPGVRPPDRAQHGGRPEAAGEEQPGGGGPHRCRHRLAPLQAPTHRDSSGRGRSCHAHQHARPRPSERVRLRLASRTRDAGRSAPCRAKRPDTALPSTRTLRDPARARPMAAMATDSARRHGMRVRGCERRPRSGSRISGAALRTGWSMAAPRRAPSTGPAPSSRPPDGTRCFSAPRRSRPAPRLRTWLAGRRPEIASSGAARRGSAGASGTSPPGRTRRPIGRSRRSPMGPRRRPRREPPCPVHQPRFPESAPPAPSRSRTRERSAAAAWRSRGMGQQASREVVAFSRRYPLLLGLGLVLGAAAGVARSARRPSRTDRSAGSATR